MQKKSILKNDKGSITLFVLLSALFFLVIVASVGVSMRNKERRVDAEFQKVKNSYEQNLDNKDAIYNEKFQELPPNDVSDKISVEVKRLLKLRG